MSRVHAVRAARFLAVLCLLLLIPLLPLSRPARAEDPGPPAMLAAPARGPDADFFGIVGRDPSYEWNTDPARFPYDVNRDALEGMARDLAQAGAGWVRIEIRAEHDDNAPAGPGYLDYRKWDWFIRECAPKYGLKVLLLLGAGLLDHSRVDPSASFARINDQPDRPDGTNNYLRLYTARAREVADHFGDSVAAYEVLNEPNISDILQQDTDGKQMEFVPENFGALLAEVYGAIKPAHPKPQLIVGGLLYGPRASGNAADVDYLWRLYRTSRVQAYRAANGRFPFDGVAIHAYYINDPRQIVDHLGALRGVMVDSGDTANKIWMTEIGYEATPPLLDPAMLAAPPTASEAEQARFMRELFALLLQQTRYFVANVFWFKYEDFPARGDYAGWGLVRLPITARGAYVQPPWPRKLAYSAYQSIANPGALPTAPEPPGAQPPDAAYFPQTQHGVSGAFRTYWQENGGLMRFGYPVTRVFEVGGVRMQYFERARFEWHTENPAPYKVELGLLTAYLTRSRNFPKGTPIVPTPTPSPTAPSPTRTVVVGPGTPTPTIVPSPTPSATPTVTAEPPFFFPQTGHNLGGEFLKYWRARGGLASFGYPISEELREVNEADGKAYTVQYFERARLEYHPENAGTDYVVLLGLMGNEMIIAGGWYR